jgi:4-amino-4-deoxy-L-arabinose transferase-like glycosyltransferase
MAAQSLQRLRREDFILLAGFCLVYFAAFVFNPHTLGIHETVHCENIHEMLADGDWIVPHYGGRPWLERPPLPFWITAGFVPVLGDADWVFLLPPVLLATGIVLLVAWMASLWFGRPVALLAGLFLASMDEFLSYACGAEADIFLCFLVTLALALFVRVEFCPEETSEDTRFFGRRPFALLSFFFVLGLTNLAKGLFFGMVLTLLPIAGVLCIRRLTGLRRYVWLWGWLAFATAALPWPLLVYLRNPDVLAFWHADYVYRAVSEETRSVFYYAVNLPWMLMPWTLCAFVGARLTMPGRRHDPEANRGRWFLLLWAVLPPLLLSVPRHKHHHYLLHALAPWSVFAAVGALRLWEWFRQAPRWLSHPLTGFVLVGIPGAVVLWILRGRLPGGAWVVPALAVCWLSCATVLWMAFSWRRAGLAFGTVLTVVCALRLTVDVYEHQFLDHYREDRAFLDQVCRAVPSNKTILVSAQQEGALCGSWWLHYSHGRVHMLHNLTFLRDNRLDPDEVYLILRRRYGPELMRYGTAEVVWESLHSKHQGEPDDRYALYRLHFHPDLVRCSGDVHFTPLQATLRNWGPFLE